MRRLIPAPLRLQARVYQRHWQDIRQGHRDRFASQSSSLTIENNSPVFTHLWDITQPIPNTSHSANKRVNLAQAIIQLNNVVLQPQQILSFWHLVGAPTRQRGYCEGRAIVGDRLSTEVGGGLCQLSGMLYWLGLQAGLQVLERHPHSQDLYNDETRYAPLGSDATVVYGYKDLRIINNQALPLSFRFHLSDDALQVSLWAPQPMPRWTVNFEAISASDLSAPKDWDDDTISPANGIWVKTMRCLTPASDPSNAPAPKPTPVPEPVSQTFYRRSL